MRRLYLALLGLSGCAAPCEQDLTETTVMSQSGLALTAAQVVMEITTFQAWTSRPVCVATVEMRRPIRRGLRQVESLVTPDGTLLLDDRAGLDGVRHALCGHVDRGTSATTELIDIDRFESFVPIEQWDRYPTVELQRAEVLSSLCESGPDHFGALDALYDEQCGGGRYQTELVQWLHEQIFDEAGQPAYPARLVRGPPREWRKPADMSDAQVLIWLDGTWLLTGDVPVEEDDREDGLGIASDDPWTLLLPLEGLHSGSVGGTVTAGGTALLTLYQTTVSVSDNFVHSQTLAVLDPRRPDASAP